jgi:outer membrane protein assembly factor BamE (lipoprotein component of BamABCDE complex)
MLSKAVPILASIGLLAVGACTPTNSFQGFQAIDASPNDVKVGTDTRATVLARLGTPTEKSVFDTETWYYLSQVTNRTAFYRPRVTKRDVVAIAFDKTTQQVVSVNDYTLKDGRVIAYNDRETPTRGREMTILEQLIGSISAASALPPSDTGPGHGNGP